jgi:alkanesulfonate monooxygenase SsuD/methylene tetrahydromethanopterin reductase-like flavin-dependent oxidoreductase (luciferase family)
MARRGEELGFDSIWVGDHLLYRKPGEPPRGPWEAWSLLAALAAATSRIELGPLVACTSFHNPALLAKQAATVNHLSDGRFVLGMAVGGYKEEYDASHLPYDERGARFDAMLDEMARIWAGERRGVAGPIGPPGLTRAQVIFGGKSPPAYRRVATHGTGWIAGSRGAEAFRAGAERVRQAWAEHGRSGTPLLMALPYFALGPDAKKAAAAYLADFYAVEGPGTSEQVLAATLTDPGAITSAIRAYEEAGCHELLLFPCSPDPAQLRMLAEVIG